MPLSATVSLQHCPGYDRLTVAHAVSKLLEPLGGMKAFIAVGDKVLIKPNLIVPRPAESAVVTHPELIRSIVQEVISAGGKPVVGDSPAFGSARSVAARCGLDKALADLDVEIIDLCNRPCSQQINPGGKMKWASLSADALEADAIINVPKVKTHTQMGMSLGLKNLFGVIPGKRKAFLHFRNGESHDAFAHYLVALTRHLKPALTIEDGVLSLERDGPTDGDPRATNFLVASADVTAADRVVLDLLGVDPDFVPYMRAARVMEYGTSNLAEIDLVGAPIEALRVADFITVPSLTPINFSLPRVLHSVIKQILYMMGLNKK